MSLRPLRPQFANQVQRFIERHVRRVWLSSQGIHDEHLYSTLPHSFQPDHSVWWDILDI